MPRVSISELLKEAAINGTITCPKCGRELELDNPKCSCGWENILVEGCWV